ncbi:MAG TPA: helix-turn-helix domain-containing protein [Longimicrobiaceae bacterium]|nr:helix-turn-helix domain-containing protein [Longimicrobiaceae bacterium]
MQTIPRPLLLLHSDPVLRQLLTVLPGPLYRLQEVAGWDALRASLQRASLAAVAVVDPIGTTGGRLCLSPNLHALLSEFPTSTIIAATRVEASESDTLQELLDWGITEWIDLARECTPAALERRLRLVRSRPVQRLLDRAVPWGISNRARALLAVAADVVAAGGQAPDMAAALGVNRRTVPRWCERADLPPPQRLLAWLRVLLAAELLDDPARSLEAIARNCGYAGAPSFKTALRNLMQTTPRALRAQGAFQTASTTFAQELFEMREQARAKGKPAKAWLH